MSDTSEILAILFATALANLAFAAWLWWRHGFIKQVSVLLGLTAALLVNAAIFAVRANGTSTPVERAVSTRS